MVNSEDNKMIVDDYAHHEIQEYQNTKVPKALIWLYILLPIWGIWAIFTYWDGSHGWMDRGYWHELEVVANTKSIKPAHIVIKEDAPLKMLSP